MLVQDLIVGVLVLACSAYAAWALMPASARRALAQRVLRWPLPAAMQRPFQKAMKPAGACGGCDNCGDEKPAARPAVQPIRFHRMPKR
jgi:hypothetical protein